MTATPLDGNQVEFITKTETILRLYRLIEEAKTKVWLVSPYVGLDKLRDLSRRIKSALERNVAVKMIVRAPDSSNSHRDPEESEQIAALVAAGMRLVQVPDLHAKMYISEKHALVTSLNLLDSSFNNSIEIGVWVPSGTAAFDQLRAFWQKELRPQIDESERRKPVVASQVAVSPRSAEPIKIPSRRRNDPPPSDEADDGFCIRCGDEIPLNPEKPFCYDDYLGWAEYENEDYTEQYCHICGKDAETSMAKPLCGKCYRQSVRIPF